MERAISETNRRRKKQQEYNEKNGIIPKTVIKEVRDVIEIAAKDKKSGKTKPMSDKDKKQLIANLTSEMKECAKNLDFERAAYLRDEIVRLSARNPE
jgi:excinuclease ABC subunit B